MKLIYAFLCLSFLAISCQPIVDNSVSEAFEKNSKTVMTYLDGFQNENLDHAAIFAKDFVMFDTHYGAEKDSLSLSDIIKEDKKAWASADFKIVSKINLLPGVSVDTKLADGSVRYYGSWEITLSATDSTDAKSGIIRLYESFDFNEEGKIVFQQYYGDFGGLSKYFSSK